MAILAANLSNLIGRPVVDLTELAGEYEFSLEYSAEDTRNGRAIRINGAPPAGDPAEPGVSLFTSIQKLGLKLESHKVPLDVIVVDHIEKTPTQN